MDAVEHLTRFDDASRDSVAQIDKRILPGTVDAREPQDMRDLAVRSGEIEPRLFGGETFVAARIDRTTFGRFVHPCASMVAIDAHG